MKKVNVCLVLAFVFIMALGSVAWASQIAVTGVSVDLTSMEMVVGDQRTLVATVSPTNATNPRVNWTSSDPSVATVQVTGSAIDGKARVTAVAPGTATIVATNADGSPGVTPTVTSVTVRAATTTPPTGGGNATLYMLLAGALITVTALTMRRLKDQVV